MKSKNISHEEIALLLLISIVIFIIYIFVVIEPIEVIVTTPVTTPVTTHEVESTEQVSKTIVIVKKFAYTVGVIIFATTLLIGMVNIIGILIAPRLPPNIPGRVPQRPRPGGLPISIRTGWLLR